MGLFKKLFNKKAEGQKEQTGDVSKEMNLEEEFNRTIGILAEFKRKAYVPKVQRTSHTFSAASKIGGFPYLKNENDWPVCPNCKKNMQLFLQLNLADLPERHDEGLIQLFYCTTGDPLCGSDLEAFFPFSKAVNCRKISVAGESSHAKPVIDEIFDEKIIIGWESQDDYPHAEEYEQLGIELEIHDDVYLLMDERRIGIPIERDKLFGWPYWVQSVEYPYDRKTEVKMELLFQLCSENNLPYMFGDAGIGHLTQSPDNSDELAFGWACA